MNEDDLRRALHDESDHLEADDDSWHRLQSRLIVRSAERSPARSMLRPAIAIVVFAALIGGLLLAVRDQPADVPAVGKAMTGLPRRVLASTPDGWLVKLNTRTGKEIGRFVAKVAPGTSVGVSPDGRTAFFTGGEGTRCRTHQIETRPIEPGPGSATIAVGASQPAISPDGRYLAYYRCRAGSEHPDELVLRDLASGSERAVRPPGKPEVYFGTHLTFEADSSHVVLELVDRVARPTGDHSPRLYQLDLVGSGELPGVGFNLAPWAFLGWLGSTDSFVGRLPTRADPATGRLGDLIMRTPTNPADRNFMAPRRLFFSAKVVQQLASDPSGRHLLFVVDDTLYRWSRGDKTPTKIRDGITAAAWIPDAPAHPLVPAPASIVVERPGSIDPGPMVVLDAATGLERGEQVHNDDVQSYVSATADGSQVVSSPSTPANCVNDWGLGVRRRDMRTQSVLPIVSGAIAPVVSARGLIAYGIVCDGHTLGFTDLRTEVNYRAEPLGERNTSSSRKLRAVEPLSWSPDGTRLLYRLQLPDDTRWHYYVGAFYPAVPGKAQKVEELPIFGVGVTAAAFLDGRHIAFAQAGDVRVLAFEHTRKRSAPRRLFSLRGTIRSLVADPSGQHVLAVVDDKLLRWDLGGTVRSVSDHVAAAAWLGGPAG